MEDATRTKNISEPQAIDIWLDCDPGHDDMMAIILAAHNPKIKVLGISTTSGNASLDKTTKNALRTLYTSGIEDVEVIPGSREAYVRGFIPPADHIFGEDGLEGASVPVGPKKALDVNLFLHLRTLLMSHPRPVTLVATGPYTNFAILLKAFPEVRPKIERIALLGGAIALGNVTEAAEYNVHSDPEAARVIYDSGLPLLIVPADVSQRAQFTPEVRNETIKKIGDTPYGKMIISLMDFFSGTCEKIGEVGGAFVHDPALIAALIKPEIFEFKLADVKVETRSQYCDGRTLFNHVKPKPNIQLAVDIIEAEFWKLMISALCTANSVSPLNSTAVLL